MTSWIEIDGHSIKLTNTQKLLWPEIGIRKIDYINVLIQLSPYILAHTSDRMLSVIRYPEGIHNPFFYQKRVPEHTPEWIDCIKKDQDNYMNLNKQATLIWLGNSATLEFHIGFHKANESTISYLVFDLDPSEGQIFEQVVEVAFIIYEELIKLHLESFIKTSGASGLQIYVPIEKKYSYEEGRALNQFFAMYFSSKYPRQITIERNVKKRGSLLYFDYLQMWKGKTIISVYSPRAVKSGAVSTPITWEELEKGIQPGDFNLTNIMDRIKEKGDLFNVFLNEKSGKKQNLDFIVQHLGKS
ncbi:MAG: DNA polymerase domain-containing protein [Firmicutes bacterium HGW-Firmicutes-1]|jgi:bifunctional non-homologous end joining protein LigD|nr:MAG: DNA polymerase domain-containing protein [Firmicutes bacterium HGW-Firmicutes-1]